jgi:hypothetical protein
VRADVSTSALFPTTHASTTPRISAVFGPIGSQALGARVALTTRRESAKRSALLISGFLALLALPVDGNEPLTLAVSPAQSFAPAVLRVRIRVEPSVANRSLEVIADSGDFYRSSEIQLEGDRSPATMNLELRGVPVGNYRVVGILRDREGHERSMAYKDVRVIGSEISD